MTADERCSCPAAGGFDPLCKFHGNRKHCDHSELRRAKTGGWFCTGTGCEFTILEPAPPSSNPMNQVTAVSITCYDGAELTTPALAVLVHVPDMQSAKAVRDHIAALVTSPIETKAKGRAPCDCARDGNGWMKPCPDRPDDRYCRLQHQPCEHCPQETLVEHAARTTEKAAAPRESTDLAPLTLRDFGYAPGNYTCHCFTCERDFLGDKRAIQCEHCASYKLARSPVKTSAPHTCKFGAGCTSEDPYKCQHNGQEPCFCQCHGI